jgi:hypothetical protein
MAKQELEPTTACITGALAHDLVHDMDGFIIDSGASHHICSNIDFMTNLKKCHYAVSLGDNRKIAIGQIGQVEMLLHCEGRC